MLYKLLFKQRDIHYKYHTHIQTHEQMHATVLFPTHNHRDKGGHHTISPEPPKPTGHAGLRTKVFPSHSTRNATKRLEVRRPSVPSALWNLARHSPATSDLLHPGRGNKGMRRSSLLSHQHARHWLSQRNVSSIT